MGWSHQLVLVATKNEELHRSSGQRARLFGRKRPGPTPLDSCRQVFYNTWRRLLLCFPLFGYGKKKVAGQLDFAYPKDHWILKTGYFETPTPAIQVQTLPLEGPMILRVQKKKYRWCKPLIEACLTIFSGKKVQRQSCFLVGFQG